MKAKTKVRAKVKTESNVPQNRTSVNVRVSWTQENITRLVKMWITDQTTVEIAKKFNCSKSSVQQQIGRLRKQGVDLKHKRTRNQIDYSALAAITQTKEKQ